jgi:membrane-associated phospholipid phosphatase
MMNLLMLSLLVIAALGGYSRVYLSQHFLSDVCVGSIIGFLTPCLLFYIGRNKLIPQKEEEAR